MKNMNLNNYFSLMPVLLLAALSSCNNGGGKNNVNTPVNTQIASVNYGGFPTFAGQSCNFPTNNTYQCFENFSGQMLQTQIIQFNSQQELCNKVNDINLNSVAVSWGQMQIASSVRSAYYTNNCQNNSNGVNTGVIQNDTNLLRNMKCTLTVEGTDGSFGSTGEMQPVIFASGMAGKIFTYMVKEKNAWIFRVITSRLSSRYIDVNYVYTKGDSGRADQLTLKGTINDTKAEVTGFAGEEVSLVMENIDPVVKAEVTCRITDASNTGIQSQSNDYRCTVGGTDKIEKSGVVIPVAELINNSLTFTSSDSLTNVTMAADGPFVLRQGKAVFSASRDGSRSAMNITAHANLSTPVKFKVRQLSKSVDVSCK